MKNKLLWINLVAPVLLSFMIIILSFKFNNKSKELNRDLEIFNQRTEIFNATIQKNDTFTYYENLLLKSSIDSSIVLEEIDGRKLSFIDLHINKPMIILFIHQTHCSSCWGKAIDIMVKDFPEIVKDRLIIITSYQNFRDIFIPLKELNLKSNVYNIIRGSIIKELPELGVPFAISTDSSLNIETINIIDNNLLSKFESYLKAFKTINLKNI